MPSDCLFCKIGAGEIPAEILFQDEFTLAFRDISPEAPSHILVISKEHQPNIHSIDQERVAPYMGQLFVTAQKVIEQENLSDKGYRIVLNSGIDGGQTVDHIHLHILGGRSLQWPPG